MLALVIAVAVYLSHHNLASVAGALLVVLGAFLGDQATHLAQEDHSLPPRTWIEQQQQNHRFVFVLLGLLIAGLGAVLI